MKGLAQSIVILFVFATAGACSPRLRRRYLEEAGRIPSQNYELSHQVGPDSRNDDEADEMLGNDIGILNRQQLALAKKQQLINRLHGGDRFEERSVRAPPSAIGGGADDDGSAELENLRGLLNPLLEAQAASGKLNPTEEGAEQYNLAMINFLLKMKDKGHKINEKEMDMPLADIHRELATSKANGNKDPLVCKTAPYNVCYRLDERGVLHPIGDRRPVRILRVYRK